MIEMKDSGIEWIGEIPNGWKIEKGKYILTYLQKPVKSDDEVITCFRDGEVTLRSNRREEGFTFSDKEIGYQGIDVGDLVVHGMDGFAGAIGISDSRGKASPVLNVFDTKHNKKYLMYYLRNMAYSEVFTALATGIRVRSCDLRWNKLSELAYPIPPIEEQNRIVRFIDNKLSEIDALTADIEKQIETLEAYKKSVITEAVTKGLNPDVEMKDSGIEWIGQIPKDWMMSKIKYVAGLFGRIGFRGYTQHDLVDEDEGAITLSPSNMINGEMNYSKCSYISWYKYYESPEIQICIGDILVVKTGSSYGKSAIVNNLPKEATINPQLLVVKNFNISNKYLFYYIQSSLFVDQINNAVVGGTIPTVAQEKIYNFRIVVPPSNECEQIEKYLDIKCAEIDSIIGSKKTQIDILTDYKKSLIYEYVTGKKEVPNE